MENKNILLITIRADIGGGPKHVDILLNNLSSGFEIFLCCPNDEPFYSKWVNNKKVKKIYLIPHRKFSIIRFFGLIFFTYKYKIDIINSDGKGAGVYSRLVKIFNPSLSIIHTFNGLNIKNKKSLKNRIYFLFEKLGSLITKKIINVSKGERDVCIRENFFSGEKSVIIYNGIDALTKSKVIPTELINLQNKFIVTCLSRFDYQKNMQLAYEIAFNLKENKDIIFLFIGDGEDREELEEKAKVDQLENTIFTGFRENIVEYLSNSHLYLSSSRWEGLPFAIIESISLGLPVVATDVTGNNEIVINDYNGYLFDLNDSMKAAEKIEILLNNKSLYNQFSKNSLTLFCKEFSAETMVKKTENVYLI